MEITSKEIEVLCNINMEYFYLASLISNDNILSIEDAENGLKDIEIAENAVKEANISEDKKKEFYKYFKKGKKILNQDIENFKKKNK